MPEGRSEMRKPAWLRSHLAREALQTEAAFRKVKTALRTGALHTVCEEARCPNLHSCWNAGTATFMILGDRCTRSCRFCAVTPGRPLAPDPEEPERVAEAARAMGLRYVVVTSVARDDLTDGGAGHFAATIRALRSKIPGVGVEVLTPDFGGDPAALRTVLEARPDVFNHNVETVRRLTPSVRAKATYERSLWVLREAKRLRPEIPTKSSLMVGLGETWEELIETMDDLRASGVDILTIGQYLRPSRRQLPVVRYYAPEEFERLREEGLRRGFAHVEAGPLVRSSYHAREQATAAGAVRFLESGTERLEV
ncbi:lipoyl synthase [Hydrogenibacillus sp. N12]|uniref:lipoyl synthase n=1 Tax=Hydrogenibacillus sp. N12 TaxID=2866627 RepID=UPI0025A56775|nr:lipoyl synthase [Hydrogenibacillus sp. N12]